MNHTGRKNRFRVAAVLMLLLVGAVLWLCCCGSDGSRPASEEVSMLDKQSPMGDMDAVTLAGSWEIASQVAQEVAEGETVEVTQEQLESNFGLTEEDCVSFCVLISKKDTSAFEIAVFQVGDDRQRELVRSALERRKNQKLANFRELNQAEYTLVQQAVTEEEGQFLLFAVCKTPARAADIFHKSAKGS